MRRCPLETAYNKANYCSRITVLLLLKLMATSSA